MPGMKPHRCAKSLLVVAALAATAAPLGAQQLYKWVDERGVTNYSNQPPPDPKTARNVRQVEDRLSVYTPDAGLTQAIEDSNRNFEDRQRARQKIEALETQLEAERRAREQAAAAARDNQAAYDRCIDDGRIDCGDVYGTYYPYAPVVGRHGRRLPQPHLTPGATAGNVTAGNSFIPGNSASAPPPPRKESPRRGRDNPRHSSPSERPLERR
ncbi:MAG TPA: DUF4124 domain-containing protein [Burkholderiales bacterium]|nr:DUF4124 domain-containing protein [Burkholderiales bacterium]